MNLDPTEALALQCLRYWWSVVKHKNGSCGEIDSTGRPWTRVSGTDAAKWIEQHYHAELNPRRIVRAFNRLVEKGYAIREQRALNHWNRSYSYAPVSPVTHRTVTTDQSNQPEPTHREDNKRPIEGSPVTLLTTTSPSTSTEKSAVGQRVEDGGRPEPPGAAQSPPVVEKVGTINNRRADSLRAILERCEGIGRGNLPNPWEEGTERRNRCQMEKGARLPKWNG